MGEEMRECEWLGTAVGGISSSSIVEVNKEFQKPKFIKIR